MPPFKLGLFGPRNERKKYERGGKSSQYHAPTSPINWKRSRPEKGKSGKPGRRNDRAANSLRVLRSEEDTDALRGSRERKKIMGGEKEGRKVAIPLSRSLSFRSYSVSRPREKNGGKKKGGKIRKKKKKGKATGVAAPFTGPNS